jgi:hypothetical protein
MIDVGSGRAPAKADANGTLRIALGYAHRIENVAAAHLAR